MDRSFSIVYKGFCVSPPPCRHLRYPRLGPSSAQAQPLQAVKRRRSGQSSHAQLVGPWKPAGGERERSLQPGGTREPLKSQQSRGALAHSLLHSLHSLHSRTRVLTYSPQTHHRDCFQGHGRRTLKPPSHTLRMPWRLTKPCLARDLRHPCILLADLPLQ